jgi:hypothetical protein
MATITFSSTKLILSTSTDWEDWFQYIKAEASFAKIWDYVNPDTPENLLLLNDEPERPTFKTIKPAAIAYSDLHDDEKDELKAQRDDYKRLYKLYEKRETAFETVCRSIEGTLDKKIKYLIKNKFTPYEMLVALKERLAPTDNVRKRLLVLEYQRLQRPPKDPNVDEWLREWQVIYSQCEEAGIAHIQGTLPHYDFLVALRSIDSSYADIQLQQLTYLEKKNKMDEIPTMYQLLDDYEDRRQILKVEKKASKHAFATFNGKSAEDSDKKDEDKDTPKGTKDSKNPKDFKKLRCPCGETHFDSECPYLNESIRDSVMPHIIPSAIQPGAVHVPAR